MLGQRHERQVTHTRPEVRGLQTPYGGVRWVNEVAGRATCQYPSYDLSSKRQCPAFACCQSPYRQEVFIWWKPYEDLYTMRLHNVQTADKDVDINFLSPDIAVWGEPVHTKTLGLCTVVQIGKAYSRGLGCSIPVSDPRRPSRRRAMSWSFTEAALWSSYAVSLRRQVLLHGEYIPHVSPSQALKKFWG